MTTKTELRHLLEMAAKACGINNDPAPVGEGWKRRHWNPYADDGDSARMRSALLIQVNYGSHAVGCEERFGQCHSAVEHFADHNGDRNAALRLCALMVAAAIGEGMK